MNIKNGDEIRKHIKDNILSADFSFLLISENYKKSEICLNEMGAVWANDNNVRYYLLPNTTFNQIGWLCDTKQAELLSEHVTLDKLYNELTNYYNIERRIETWSRQRVAFVKNISRDIIESTKSTLKLCLQTLLIIQMKVLLNYLRTLQICLFLNCRLHLDCHKRLW